MKIYDLKDVFREQALVGKVVHFSTESVKIFPFNKRDSFIPFEKQLYPFTG